MRWTKGLLIASHCVILGLMGAGCGLDGVKGTLVQIEGEHYVLQEPNGNERTLHVDSRTHKDVVQPGDEVQVYITKEGHAEFIQRLEK